MPRWCRTIVGLGLLAAAPGCGAGKDAPGVGLDVPGLRVDWEAPGPETPGSLQLRFSACGPTKPLARRIASLPPVPRMVLYDPCDLDVLRGVTGLRELYISLVRPTDLVAVRRLSGLVYLDVLAGTGSAIVDVAALDGHPSLEFLDLRISAERGDNFVGVERLATLPRLRLLYLRGHRNLRRLDAIGALPELRFLELPRSGVTDLAPLAAAARLTSLDITDTAVADLAPLASVPALRTLAAGGTQIRDLAPLRGAALTSLRMDGTAVRDLAPLAAMTTLRNLSLARVAVTDIGPLVELTSLIQLDLSGTGVTDGSALAKLTSLIFLELEETPVADIACVRGMRDLEQISLGRAVTSLEPLRGLPALRVVSLSVRTADTVEVLRTLPALTWVGLADGTFSPAEVAALRQRRPDLRVRVGSATVRQL